MRARFSVGHARVSGCLYTWASTPWSGADCLLFRARDALTLSGVLVAQDLHGLLVRTSTFTAVTPLPIPEAICLRIEGLLKRWEFYTMLPAVNRLIAQNVNMGFAPDFSHLGPMLRKLLCPRSYGSREAHQKGSRFFRRCVGQYRHGSSCVNG